MEYTQQNNYPKAFLATGIVLAALAALCYFIVFIAPPKEIEGTGGILVNYGTSDQGTGADYSSKEEPSIAPKANHTVPNKVTPAPPTEQKTQVDNSDKKVVTQNNEDAPAVAANSKKTSPTVATEPTKKIQKEVVNQSALYKGKANNGTGTGDGTTGTPGNQGNPNGSTLTNNYNGTGSGNGGDMSLGQRSFITAPKVSDNHRVSGRIYIEFLVDKNGNVSQVGVGRGTTITDNALIEQCIAAIRNSKITPDENAPDEQRVRKPFIFILK